MLNDLRARLAAEDERDHWKGVAYALACRIHDIPAAIEMLEAVAEQTMPSVRRQCEDAIAVLRNRTEALEARSARRAG